MVRKTMILILVMSGFFFKPAEAKNKVRIKISCTIPPLVSLNLNNTDFSGAKKKSYSTVTQIEKKIRGGKRVIVKTVLLK